MQQHSRFVTFLSVIVIAIAAVQWLWSAFGLDREGRENYPLNRYISLYEDTTNALTIDDVRKPDIDRKFPPQGDSVTNLGFSTSTFWVRIELPHFGDSPRKEWFLEAGRSLLDVAVLYRVNDDGTTSRLEPDQDQRVDEYKVPYANPTWVVTTEVGKSRTYYLQMKNRTAFFVPIILWDPSAFVASATVSEFLYGVFYGGMIVMFIYNLFVWFVMRDDSYLYYAGYIASATIFEFTDFGRGHDLLGSYGEWFDKQNIPFFIWMTWTFGLLFGRSFLELHTRHPVLNRIVETLIVIAVVNGGLSYSMPYYDSQLASVAFSLCFLLFIPFLGFYSHYKGNQIAVYFNLAWIFNISGFVIYSTVALGLSTANALTVASMPMGTLLEVVLLSFALGHRMKEIEQATLRAKRRGMLNLVRFRSVFDNAVEGIYQMSLDGTITNANRSLVQRFGFTSEADLKENSLQVRKQLYPNPRRLFHELSQKGRLTEEIEITPTPDSGPISAVHSIQLIRDAGGKPTHIEGTFVDITERKERDRAEKERSLERMEKEFAKLATEAKSDFLKKMSYEIRMPLATIMGFSEALRYARLPPAEKKELVTTVLANSRVLLTLINDILDYSKIEAGKMPIERIKTDLFVSLEKLQSVIERQCVRRGLHFEVQYAFPLPREIHTDPTRLKQILENLCYHAIEVTPQGQITLNVAWNDEHQHLHFSLHDNSGGMGEGELEHLFDVFSQNSSGSRRQHGSGLGMVIARQLAELVGGKLEIKSRPRQGTHYDFRLECQVPPRYQWVTSVAPTIATKPLQKGEVPKLSGHILLAEDNTVNQQLIQRVIRKTGAMVTVVADGQQAVSEAQATAFDLILMDVNMPVMGGLEATQTLRRSGYHRPIFALTAEQGADEIDACLVAGCDGHLGKPLELEKFYAVLAQHLRNADNDLQQTGLQ